VLPEIVIGASSRYINKMKVHIRQQAMLQQIQGVMAKDPISIRYLENPLKEFHFNWRYWENWRHGAIMIHSIKIGDERTNVYPFSTNKWIK